MLCLTWNIFLERLPLYLVDDVGDHKLTVVAGVRGHLLLQHVVAVPGRVDVVVAFQEKVRVHLQPTVGVVLAGT